MILGQESVNYPLDYAGSKFKTHHVMRVGQIVDAIFLKLGLHESDESRNKRKYMSPAPLNLRQI